MTFAQSSRWSSTDGSLCSGVRAQSRYGDDLARPFVVRRSDDASYGLSRGVGNAYKLAVWPDGGNDDSCTAAVVRRIRSVDAAPGPGDTARWRM